MLELTKKILRQVSFDPMLFQKELHKAMKWITDTEEMYRLRTWCFTEFGTVYPKILKSAFEKA